MPYGSHSHKNTLTPLLRGLARRNHTVTFITNERSSILDDCPTVEQVVIADLKFTLMGPEEATDYFRVATQPSINYQWKIYRHMSGLIGEVINKTYSTPRVQEILRNDHYDLLLLSQVTSYAGYPLAWHFHCPFIMTSPNILMTDTAYQMGDYEHPEYVPFIFSTFTDRMTLTQRTVNTILIHALNVVQNYIAFPWVDNIVRRFFPNCPSLYELHSNMSGAFANTHPVFNYPRTYPPGVVELGAIHCRPPKPLPANIEPFVSNSGSDGFIMFGVGSIIRMDRLPEQIVQVFVDVFSRIPQRVIWQWPGLGESQFIPKVSDNVMLVNWLPQQDLLGHPKCRVFMTHGGLLSTQEAVYHGVPVLGLPFINDQLLNMDKAVKDGYALQLRWTELDRDNLYDKIRQLTEDDRFRTGVQRLQKLLHDQPEKPVDRGVFWTEYMIRHSGASHLRLASRKLNRFQRSLLDVYIILIFAAVVFVVVLSICIKRFCQICIRVSKYFSF